MVGLETPIHLQHSSFKALKLVIDMRVPLAYGLAASMAQHVVGSIISPIPGYGVDIIEWDVYIGPGRNELLNGTVEQVYEKLLQMYPEWVPLAAPAVPAVPAVPAAPAAPEKRGDKVKRGNVICGVWPQTNKVRIFEGVQYLHWVKGSATNGPGPGNCARVSCSYNSAIWWCNDNPYDYTLETFDRIADSAKQIVDTCTTLHIQDVSGQNFENGNWNTIVRYDTDRC